MDIVYKWTERRSGIIITLEDYGRSRVGIRAGA